MNFNIIYLHRKVHFFTLEEKTMLLIAIALLYTNSLAENDLVLTPQISQPTTQIAYEVSISQNPSSQNLFLNEVEKLAGPSHNQDDFISGSKHLAAEKINFQNNFINEVVKQSCYSA